MLLLIFIVGGQKTFAETIPEPVFGGQAYIEQAGTPGKPAVVLIHGLGDEAATSWDTTTTYLEKDYAIFKFDLPGFRRSSKANELYSPENYTKLIRFLTQKYVPPPFHLVGHSMGGAIALNYVATHPDDVKTLTLANPAGILHRLAYSKFLVPLGIDFMTNGSLPGKDRLSQFAGKIMSSLDQRLPVNLEAMMPLPVFRAQVLGGNPNTIAAMALVLHDFSQIPEQVKAPTLIVWGENDSIAPVRTGYVLNALIPNSQLEIISDAGHIPFVEAPRKFHQFLLSHLSRPKALTAHSFSRLPNRVQHTAQSCENEKNKVYTGTIEQLSIRHCSKVLIQDARITQLSIVDSTVEIRNSHLKSDRTALISQSSHITFTAGTVEGDIAIKAYQSQLDIAGTLIIGKTAAITAPVESTALFSLGRIDSPHQPGQIMHGQTVITPHKPL
ncbi:MAG: alpha/beta hydrolase [Gammaproteobacteria bacterium]|nr:alpha/beta hydrolase [Gammaproteobacteria bacterium]